MWVEKAALAKEHRLEAAASAQGAPAFRSAGELLPGLGEGSGGGDQQMQESTGRGHGFLPQNKKSFVYFSVKSLLWFLDKLRFEDAARNSLITPNCSRTGQIQLALGARAQHSEESTPLISIGQPEALLQTTSSQHRSQLTPYYSN